MKHQEYLRVRTKDGRMRELKPAISSSNRQDTTFGELISPALLKAIFRFSDCEYSLKTIFVVRYYSQRRNTHPCCKYSPIKWVHEVTYSFNAWTYLLLTLLSKSKDFFNHTLFPFIYSKLANRKRWFNRIFQSS